MIHNNGPVDVARAWKDAAYRNGLSAEQRAQLPAHPAGTTDLTPEELGQVNGGRFESTAGCYSKRTTLFGCGGCPA